MEVLGKFLSHPAVAAALAAILTAVLTYLATIRGIKVQQELERKRRAEDRREETSRLAAALKAEMESLRDRYNSRFAPRIDGYRSGAEIPLVTVTFDYFEVFDNNAYRIGLFQPEDAKLLVSVYIAMKGFLGLFKQFSERVRPEIATTEPGIIDLRISNRKYAILAACDQMEARSSSRSVADTPSSC